MPQAARARKPARLRWLIAAAAALSAAWLLGRPSAAGIDARIDRAVALATECQPLEAQAELIALRSGGASEEQLARVQQALDEASASCRRSRHKGGAHRKRGARGT